MYEEIILVPKRSTIAIGYILRRLIEIFREEMRPLTCDIYCYRKSL